MSQIPSLQQLLGKQSQASGILTKFDSNERVVPESRRPDGTIRKERKIRPGFTPAEDAAKFKSSRQVEADLRKPPPGSVPGLTKPSSPASVALANMSAAARKNAKRKEKRKSEQPTHSSLALNQQGDQLGEPQDVPDDWDVDESVPAPPPPTRAEDSEKRVKALQKKIRQAESLKDRSEKGETLLSEQIDKVESLPVLIAELESLSLDHTSTHHSKSGHALIADDDPADLTTRNSAALPATAFDISKGPVTVSHPLSSHQAEDAIEGIPVKEDAYRETARTAKT